MFDSWTGERAVQYRRLNRIPDEWGTAVNVQQMVFGNKGDTSGSGVAFSRDEVTGAKEPSGDFLPNAQGEDVVSGVRNTKDIAEMKEWLPEAHKQLMEILRTLEKHYKDMQDTEFTVEEGQLFMLQTRNAKRPAQAAVRFACDAVDERLLKKEEALATIDPASLDALLHPTFDPKAEFEVLATGVNASPGAAKGEVVFTAADAVAAEQDGPRRDPRAPVHRGRRRGRLPRRQGDPHLRGRQGVARRAGGARHGPAGGGRRDRRWRSTSSSRCITVDGTKISEGDRIAIDGTKGCVTLEDVPLVDPEVNEYFERVLKWADEFRRLGVRANADTPEDAKKARELGAEGIGLCRTEHMFMAEDRQPKMRAMIMADDEEGRREALAELLPFQQEDFEGLFEAMKGLPVTIRLLDPPLHEFLKNLPDLRAQVERARIECTDDLEQLEKTLARVEEIHEENPMLGTRGCRLGILYPEIYEMQVEAIMRAVAAMDSKPHPEIMIPLIDYEHELEILRELVVGIGDEHDLRESARTTRSGTMIELPRACFVANKIAEHADFFSFGTNDLTQTALGLLARRRRVQVRARLHGAQDHRPLAVRDDRQAGGGVAGPARGVGRARGAPGAQARDLRRARRRPGVDRLLPHGRARLRLLLAVPRPDRPRGRRTGANCTFFVTVDGAVRRDGHN